MAAAEVRPGYRGGGGGVEEDVFVAGVFGVPVDAGDGVVEPFAAGAEGVVVEGVHAGVLEAFVGGPAVPAFPDGGGALFDGEEPGGEGVLEEQLVGGVDFAGVGEGGEEVADADEAGGEMVAFGVDVVFEMLGGVGAEVVGQQVELERHGVAGLGVAGDAAVGRRRISC